MKSHIEAKEKDDKTTQSNEATEKQKKRLIRQHKSRNSKGKNQLDEQEVRRKV